MSSYIKVDKLGNYLKVNKLAAKFKENLDAKARDQLPDEYKNISKKQSYLLLFLTQATAAAVFIYFCYQSYQSQINAVFLALDKSSGVCTTVAKSVTGIFYASDTGYWSGSENYKPNEGLYRFQFANLYATQDEFASLIQEYNDNFIQPLGLVAKSTPLQYNLLNLMYYTAKIEKNGFIQKLDYIIDPPIVFAGRKFLGLLNKKALYTGIPDRIDYDIKTGRITYNFDIGNIEDEAMNGYTIPGTSTTIGHVCFMDQTEFQQQLIEYPTLDRYTSFDYSLYSPTPIYLTLGDMIDIKTLDYNPQFGPNFAFEFDQVTLTSAAAVNLGILAFEDLLDAGYGSAQGTYKGVSYDLKYYIVDKYTYMTPMICLSRIIGFDSTAAHPFDHYCFYKLGNFQQVLATKQVLPMLAVPSFMHMGYNSKSGKLGTEDGNFFFPSGPVLSRCICPQPVFYDINFFQQTTSDEQPFECNGFSFFSSLVLFPESNYGPGLDDPFMDWLDSGSQIYCPSSNETYSQVHCDLDTMLLQCPDAYIVESTQAYKTCANAIAVTYVEQFYQFVFGQEIGPVIDLVTQYNAKDLNEAVYDASFASCGPFYIPNSDGSKCPNSFDNDYDAMYSNYNPTAFCNDACTVMVTSTDSGYLSSNAVNAFLRQEEYLSCNDTLSVSKDALELLKYNAPTQLIEQYLQCTARPADAIQTAIGIATGWVGLVVPAFVIVALTLVSVYYSKFIGELPPTDESMKEADLQEKLDFLLKSYESVKKEAESKISALEIELVDAKKMATLTQVDLIRLKQEKEKEKANGENNSDLFRRISFGLV